MCSDLCRLPLILRVWQARTDSCINWPMLITRSEANTYYKLRDLPCHGDIPVCCCKVLLVNGQDLGQISPSCAWLSPGKAICISFL